MRTSDEDGSGESDIVFEPIYDADMSSSEVRRFASGGAVVTISTAQGSITSIQNRSFTRDNP